MGGAFGDLADTACVVESLDQVTRTSTMPETVQDGRDCTHMYHKDAWVLAFPEKFPCTGKANGTTPIFPDLEAIRDPVQAYSPRLQGMPI